MCDSATSGGSTSVAFEEHGERDEPEVRPEIDVCVVSVGGSSPTHSAKRRLLFGREEEKRSPGYKLRAKIRGTDRFNPFKKTEAEMARFKQRRLDKRRRELEDDAGSPLKAEESRGTSARQEAEEPRRPGSGSRAEFRPKEHFKEFMKKPMGSTSSYSRKKQNAGLKNMLHQLNESLRRTVSVPSSVPPGTGKKIRKGHTTRSSSSTDLSREFPVSPPAVSAPAAAPSTRAPAVFAAAAAAAARTPLCTTKIHKAFEKLWDEATLNKLRGDFTLPFVMLRESKAAAAAAQVKGESDDDSSPCLVAVTGSNAGKNEFSVKLNVELGKPFNMDELRSKMKSVRHQTPVVKSRDLRGQRSVDFTTEQEGLSYLDHHPGLASALKLVAEPEEKLRLLRGFFFWIEHACMEGSFRPWDSKPADREAVIVID